MSEITRGVLRMPPELWGDDPLSVAHRHARYVDAADTIDRLQAECDALRALLLRIRAWDMMDTAADGEFWRREIDAAIDAAREGK